MTIAGTRAIVNTGKGKMENDLKKSKACWVWRPKLKVLDHDSKNSGSYICKQFDYLDPTDRIKLQELASPKQMVLSKANGLGKDFPNPFMAGSLPKTIKQSNDPPLSRGYTLESGEDSLELMELMANYTQLINMLVEKKYPLKKEILEKMINLKLQAEEESTMAFELIVGIKREFSMARTPQQNGVAERKTRPLLRQLNYVNRLTFNIHFGQRQ
ncbi:ribonuclease H-like domain-containing protein [Tanacetum coccineum]